MLGQGNIILQLDHTTVELKPSLRAALALVRVYGDPASLASAVSGGNVTACRDIIRHAAVGEPFDVLAFMHGKALADVLATVKAPLVAFVLAMLVPSQSSQDKTDNPSGDEKPATFIEAYERLFTLGTGYLGWEPEAVWNATPAEIAVAYTGRLELLQSIFGSNDNTTGKNKPSLDAQAKALFGGLGTTKVKRHAN